MLFHFAVIGANALLLGWPPESHAGCIVLQVAGRVDMLDGRVKQEQESSLRALEAILSESGHGKR